MSESQESGPSRRAQTDAAAPGEPLVEAASATAVSPTLSLGSWLREGLRAAVFLKPRLGPQQPTPAQFVLLLLLVMVLQVALGRFEIHGPANFDLRGWLAPKWSDALLLLLAWVLLPAQRRDPGTPFGLTAWLALVIVGAVPANALSQLLVIADRDGLLQAWLAATPLGALAVWTVYLLPAAWMMAVAVRLAWVFGADRFRQGALVLGLGAIVGLSFWFPDRPWQEDVSRADEPARERLELSQETFESQQAVWAKAVAGLAPQRPGVTDVYAIVFAPYDQDVFLRESSMVARLLEERFDARGRVLQMVNNTATTKTHPWATALNLERAIAAIAQKMDRDNDLLLVYLTSHGASDFKLASSHWPLEAGTVSPAELRAALDKAGVRYRAIAISACFAGGWVAPLASDETLVMTAADATHTSYGCGSKSELTFFGRAVFDEQLRKTHSLEDAFAAAVPLIRQREIDGHKSDGFSNPQISVGEKLRPLLKSLAQRLDAKS